MDTHKAIRPSKKPSTMLGFLMLFFVLMFGVGFVWQVFFLKIDSPLKFQLRHWAVVIPACAAIMGWLVTSWLTLRNSIKQHTITTLLQSRLSATYMGYADKIGAHYTAYDKRRKANADLKESPTDGVDELALRYVLNYFEFIAIGIKRGDLDESMLKDSLRGILRKNVAMSRMWLVKQRKGNPSLYEHVVWLYARWSPEDTPLM